MSAGEPIGVGQQDPDATLSYTIDWTDWLGGLSIGGSSFAIVSTSTGASLPSSTYSSTTTVFVFSGGTAGETYVIRNRITTSTSTGAAQLGDDRTVHIEVLER